MPVIRLKNVHILPDRGRLRQRSRAGDFLRVMRLQVVENLFQAAVGGRSIAAFIERGFVLTEKAPGDDPEGKQDTIYLKRAFRCVIL